MTMKIEIRGDQVLLDGYVNAVGRESRVLPSPRGKFVEVIAPRTFEKALRANPDVDLLFNHDANRKLGSTKEGNLELYEDAIGLRAMATVTDPEVIKKANNGELKGWSFGFVAQKDTWETRENAVQRREIEEMELIEVSILDKTPAYIATSIESRGEENVVSEVRNHEFDPRNAIQTNRKNDSWEIVHSINEKQLEILKIKGGN